MEKYIKFGESINNGQTTDILAKVSETEKGIEITGAEPFAGVPISFMPIPEGFKGVCYIHKQKTLSDIVRIEENTVFRMGSIPTCYYEYKDGYCHGYYDIEPVLEDPEKRSVSCE